MKNVLDMKSILLSVCLFLLIPVMEGRAQSTNQKGVPQKTVAAQPYTQPYQMAGPYEVVARDGAYRASKGGSERDMKAAWDLARAGRHEESVRIINAYAETLQRLDGHDAPLCLIQGYWLCRAMSLEKARQTPAWTAMLKRAMLPVVDKFEADSPYANGNWGAIVNRFRMAAALFMQDSALYRAAIDYYLHAYDNGSLPRYISASGQFQESGRDQGHAQLGLETMADICEMAWQQGDDLWGALDNRLMRGFEYAARYNLGFDVPFETWTDCTGLYCDWTEPGEMGRGRLWDIYELPYRHYVGRKRLKMPYTKQVLALQDKAEKSGGKREVQAPGVVERPKLHQVFTYPAPVGAPLKHDYEVYVQPRGTQEWTRVDTYMAKVNASIGDRKHRVSEISYCVFDFTGDVFVKVVSKKRKFTTARIRPDYRGTIANVQNDSTVQFLLFQPENVSVELDGDITENLLVFTSKPPVSREQAEREARAEGRTFQYYPAGFYRQETIRVPSNTTLYLEGGTYFEGTFAVEDAENVRILGRGIARPPRGYEGAHVHRSSNVLLDGLVLNTCPIGESRNVPLPDVRCISHPSWGDGLNVFGGCDGILFDRVFCRTSDDCTTAYATRKGFSGSTRNVHMRNSTLWADVAHPIFIGLHGNPEVGDTIEHLVYENIDILGQAEPQVDYQGCLAINAGDGNLVRDVRFDNIRIEQIEDGSIAHVKVGYNQKYCTAPGLGVEDVVFRNVRYTGTTPSLSIINGYDATRSVRNVTFEGLKVNGQVIHDQMPGKPGWYATSDYVPMFVGNHASGVVFTKNIAQFNVDQQLAYCSAQVDRALAALRPYDFTQMPRNILAGQTVWNLRPATPQEWCTGFWPGILWMAQDYNHSEAVMKAATGYTDAVIPLLRQPVYDHDLGFIATGTFLKAYASTQEARYKQLALQAADSLATLFNEHVGTLLSWPRHVADYGGHNTIMDNMMNLEFLYWAAANGGNPRWKDIATRHAETTMRHQFRPDGSNYHVAVYHPLTGRFIKALTHQGYSDDSMWSRGQAWAIYGYTVVYRYTRDPRFLAFARKVAAAYLRRLRATSADWVPRGGRAPPPPPAPKDASAACIVASALLELSQQVDAATAHTYRDAAQSMLRDLSTSRYQSRGTNTSFLLHSTGHHPAGTEIDASIIYADYYYLEALTRLKALNN
jgi:hypothetical protein